MKIVYSWLKDFVDIDVPVEELADALTGSGLEVAAVEHRRAPDGIVAAKVLEKTKHPNADKLSVCTVDAGGESPLTIVCGAPNVEAGMNVACATIGTAFSQDFVIKKTKLRGIDSFGMLCSEKELGLSDDHSGLFSMPQDIVPGRPFGDYFPPDSVIEIELTPNRGDCLSVIGVAREVAARFGLPMKNGAIDPEEKGDDPIENAITVTLEAAARCPRYAGRLVRGVKIGPSPRWIQDRLRLAGLRPINNVVDVTNYMLMHFGQPMHAFDYAGIAGSRIIVKTAQKEMTFLTLDDIERNLVEGDLLIADANGPVALAGIMGGAGSQIADTTTDVFLECAYFDPVGIRKTSKRLGLSSDSSYRFERGVDPDVGLTAALDTAAALLAATASGSVCKGRIDARGGEPMKRRTINLRTEKVSSVLGVPFSGEQISSFLQSLQIECLDHRDGTFSCTVPLFRHDLTIEEDLIEEVGRMYGYDNIPPAQTTILPLARTLPTVERTTDTIRHALAFAGLHEAVTNSMTSEKRVALLTPEIAAVKLLNPLTPDMAFMRTTLAGSLLDITAYNCNRRNRNNRFFEIGKIFQMLPSGEYAERTVIAIIIEGNFHAATWNSAPQPVSFYVLKGIIESFCRHIGFETVSFSLPHEKPRYFGPETALVKIGDKVTGFAGTVFPQICAEFDIKSVVCFAQLDITDLLETALPVGSYKPLHRFPALERDFCFVMDERTGSSAVMETIAALSPLIEEVHPFDVYRGEKLGPGRKSITFNVVFRSSERTLTDGDVEELCEKVLSTVAQRCGGVLRT